MTVAIYVFRQHLCREANGNVSEPPRLEVLSTSLRFLFVAGIHVMHERCLGGCPQALLANR